MQSFADAQAAVADVRRSAMQEMQQAEDKESAVQIRQQAQQDMIAAIEDAGLSVKEYNQIGRAAQSSPQLAQKIQQMQ